MTESRAFNLTRDQYVDLLKNTAIDVGAKSVMNYLASKFPFFLLPVVNPVATFVVQRIVSLLVKKTEFGAFFLFIDARTNAQGRDFIAAAYANQAAQGGGNEEEKKLAEARLINSFRTFVKFNS